MSLQKSKKDTIDLSRRGFMVGTVNASLLMAFAPAALASVQTAKVALTEKAFSPTVWFEMNGSGEVLVNIARAEMGQHVGTALARIVADELGCDWAKVSIRHVDTDPKWGYMVTGGSWSVFQSYKPLSQAGAAGRTVLIDAAAKLLGVSPDTCEAKDGLVVSGSKKISFGDIVTNGDVDRTFTTDELGQMPIKPADKLKLVGKDTRALDIPAKTNGSATFGIDVEVDGMIYARPVMPPTTFGSKVTSVDDTEAKKVSGYLGHYVLDDPTDTCQGWVVVTANNYYSAVKAADALTIAYQKGKTAEVSEADIQARGKALAMDPANGALFVEQGDMTQAREQAANTIEAVYTTATASHFHLEPVNAVAYEQEGQWHVHTGNQWQSLTLPRVAEAAQVTEDKVTLHQYYLGGGFGRRLYGDYSIPTVLTAKAAGKPVKLVFTRPDDSYFDQPRSASTSVFRASFNQQGDFTGMEHTFAAGWPTKAMASGFLADAVDGKGKIDPFSASGADHWYTMANHRATAVNNDLAHDTFTPGWLRSVGQGWILFGLESFIDEIAHQAGQDPVAFRLSMLDGKGKQGGSAPESVGGANRLRKVLEQLQAKVKNTPLGKDEGLGFSVTAGQERTMPCWIATAAHVHVNRQTGDITLKKLTAVVDAGIVVHPDGGLAQLEGSLLWGTSLALHEGNAFENGRVKANNLNAYTPLRMNQVPDMDIEFVQSNEFPVGLGEPGVVGVAPAISNAIYQAVGVRLRDLPMRAAQLKEQLKA
ncbi:xanthine dehydrogenase family protein molybdopterin-binding subunit [Salinimonas sediminis]|nr:molybdopterin cofactor-binding domain-containing protein [Salinimonas sediminis]